LLVKRQPVPKLAGDLFVRLIQRFAVVCVCAPSNLGAVSATHFLKPVRIGECLSRKRDNIGVPTLQYAFRLIKGRNAACSNEGGSKAGVSNIIPDLSNEWNIAAKRTN
jgi:hypothetical protein